MKIRGAAVTNVGVVRSSNEDCVIAGLWKEDRSMIVPKTFEFSEPRSEAVLVADGMGGHRAGECASRMAANAFLESDQLFTNSDSLVGFLKGVNRAIFQASSDDADLTGMGTTVAGVVCNIEGLLWFNVGDSKVFRYRDGFLRQLSVDDVAQRAVTSGTAKGGLTQALGGAPQFIEIEPHVGSEPLADGWRYLICSDGLTDVIPTPAIEDMISESDEATVQLLLDTTLEKGAPDNVSIIMITVLAETADEVGGTR